MAQPLLGFCVLHTRSAGGRRLLGDGLPGYGRGYWRSDSCCSAAAGATSASPLAAAAVLYLLRRVWLGAYLYPATLALLLLQLSIWYGDAACARSICLRRGAVGGGQMERFAAAGEKANAADCSSSHRAQRGRDDVPH